VIKSIKIQIIQRGRGLGGDVFNLDIDGIVHQAKVNDGDTDFADLTVFRRTSRWTRLQKRSNEKLFSQIANTLKQEVAHV
jgi:alpha-acetolactate decarboxylase